MKLRSLQLQARSKPEFQRRSRKHCGPGGGSRGTSLPARRLESLLDETGSLQRRMLLEVADRCLCYAVSWVVKSTPAKLLATLAEAFTFGRPKVLHDDG